MPHVVSQQLCSLHAAHQDEVAVHVLHDSCRQSAGSQTPVGVQEVKLTCKERVVDDLQTARKTAPDAEGSLSLSLKS